MDDILTADPSIDGRLGTRFWVFPQAPFIPGYEKPERIWLPVSPEDISAGPSDDRMYVVDPLFGKEPYAYRWLPPFEEAVHPPVTAGADGHFDQLDYTSRPFCSAHAFACVNLVLSIWESFLGHKVSWFFSDYYPRLEIVALIDWDNAAAGYGFLELGRSDIDGVSRPYALNFDTIAHEVAHLILTSEIGIPGDAQRDLDYFSYSEAVADIVSFISFLHFDTAIDRLLRRTSGNLLIENELNRFAETSPETQIRRASNARRYPEVSGEPHDRAAPFVGAMFDSLVDLYHRELACQGLADPDLAGGDFRYWSAGQLADSAEVTKQAFQSRPLAMKSALERARDEVARALSASWISIRAEGLSLSEAAQAITDSAEAGSRDIFAANFSWREIGYY